MEILKNTIFEKYIDLNSNAWWDGKVVQPVNMTLGRYIRRKLKVGKDIIDDTKLAIFTASIGEYTIEILHGDDLIQLYTDAYGNTSCMTGCDSHKVGLWAMNPDKVEILKYNGEHQARALLFHFPEGDFIDRIYTDAPDWKIIQNRMVAFMQKFGEIVRCRPENSYEFHPGDIAHWEIALDLPELDSGEFPYSDSFNQLDLDGMLALTGDYSLDQTNGILGGSDYNCCENCQGIFALDEIFYMDDTAYCLDCIDDIASPCAMCCDYAESVTEINDEFYCEDCVEEHFTYCSECEEYYMGEHGCEDCGCCPCACSVCDNCGETGLELEETKTGEMVCPECAKDYIRCDGCDALAMCSPGSLHQQKMHLCSYCMPTDKCACGVHSDTVRCYNCYGNYLTGSFLLWGDTRGMSQLRVLHEACKDSICSSCSVDELCHELTPKCIFMGVNPTPSVWEESHIKKLEANYDRE